MKNLSKIDKLKLWQKYCEDKRKKHPLEYLFWECSIKCNLNCRHCGSSCSPEERIKDELTTDEIKKALYTIAEDFNPMRTKRIMIGVTGGEPLLRKDIFEVMKYAEELGFSWGMVTNGTLITPEIIAKMEKAKMSTISISLDGLEKSHDWLRGNDNFKRAVNGIKLLVASRPSNCKIEVITCVNQHNIDELENIYQLCSDLKVDQWRLVVISPIGRAKNNPDLFLNSQQFRYLLEYIKYKRKEGRNNLKVEFCDEGFLGTEYEGEVRDGLFYCWAGITVGSILYNGDIAACPNLPREFVSQGNIRQNRFSRVWDEKYEIFRNRSWRRQGKCKKCQWWKFCEGNSLHLWNFYSNELMLCNYSLINQVYRGKP